MSQTDGGYLGSDSQTLFSAVVSGAGGVFAAILLEDAGIETTLVVRPSQRVSVSGDASLRHPPRWGGGGFTVQQRGSLTLQFVAIAGSLSVAGGGTLVMMACAGQQLTSLTVTDSSFSASTTTLGGSISLSNAGSVALEDTTFAEGVVLTVGGGTSLRLSSVALSAVVMSGGELSLQSCSLPADAMTQMLVGAQPGSVVRLSEVTVPDSSHDLGSVNGSVTVGADGVLVCDPPDLRVCMPQQMLAEPQIDMASP